jgi:hypothetical protein
VANLVVGELDAVQVLADELVVVIDCGLENIVPRLLDCFLIDVGNVYDFEFLAERRVVEDLLQAHEEVDVARE